MRDVVEDRALSLYRVAGLRTVDHPGMVELASVLPRAPALRFVSSARGGSLCSISPEGTWSIHLIDTSPDEVIVLTIARGLARWEAAMRPGLSREQVEQLALAILCPVPLMHQVRDRNRWSIEEIAAFLVVPVEVAHVRSMAVRPLRTLRKAAQIREVASSSLVASAPASG